MLAKNLKNCGVSELPRNHWPSRTGSLLRVGQSLAPRTRMPGFVYKTRPTIEQITPSKCYRCRPYTGRRSARVDAQTAGHSGLSAADLPGGQTLGAKRGGLVVGVAGGGRADSVVPRHRAGPGVRRPVGHGRAVGDVRHDCLLRDLCAGRATRKMAAGIDDFVAGMGRGCRGPVVAPAVAAAFGDCRRHLHCWPRRTCSRRCSRSFQARRQSPTNCCCA